MYPHRISYRLSQPRLTNPRFYATSTLAHEQAMEIEVPGEPNRWVRTTMAPLPAYDGEEKGKSMPWYGSESSRQSSGPVRGQDVGLATHCVHLARKGRQATQDERSLAPHCVAGGRAAWGFGTTLSPMAAKR